jgi:hypothetical protein
MQELTEDDITSFPAAALGFAVKCLIPFRELSPFILQILALSTFSNLFITIATWAFALYQKELYLTFLAIGLTGDWLLNSLLATIVKGPPPIGSCGEKHAWPAWTSEHAAFVFFMAFTFFPLYLKTPRFGVLLFAVLVLYASIFTSLFLNRNTIGQVLSGVAIGAVLSVSYQIAVWYFLAPRFKDITNSALGGFCGYVNNATPQDD